jgi:hypothetical protein
VLADIDPRVGGFTYEIEPAGARFAVAGRLGGHHIFQPMKEVLVRTQWLDVKQANGACQARLSASDSLAAGHIAVGEDGKRPVERPRSQQPRIRIEVGAFDSGHHDPVPVEIEPGSGGQRRQNVSLRCAFDQHDMPGEQDLGSRDVEISLRVSDLFRAQETWRHDPGHALPGVWGEEHQAVQWCDGGDMRAVGV